MALGSGSGLHAVSYSLSDPKPCRRPLGAICHPFYGRQRDPDQLGGPTGPPSALENWLIRKPGALMPFLKASVTFGALSIGHCTPRSICSNQIRPRIRRYLLRRSLNIWVIHSALRWLLPPEANSASSIGFLGA